MLGSANISGSRLMHFMSGNLSFQIEHHLFPDLPSNRYQEIAPRVQELFERYGLTYTTGSLPKQVASAWKKVFKLSLPNDFKPSDLLRRATSAVSPTTLTKASQPQDEDDEAAA
ncbi:MAG: desA3, partial [Mycobacterium sp.]|nr:desA3 [Mycobacterium sp.]